MRTFRALACALSLIVTAVLVNGPSHAAAEPFIDPAPTRLDAVVLHAVKSEGFSGAVLVRQGNRILLRQGYGVADNGRPNTAKTEFVLPGMADLFAAVAAEQLAERGTKLPSSLRADIQEDAGSTGLDAAISLVQRTSGQTYAKYLRGHVFRPLGLTHTHVGEKGGAVPAISSTVGDLDRLTQGVLGCVLVSPGALLATAGSPWHPSSTAHGPVIQAIGARGEMAAGERILLGRSITIIILANRGGNLAPLLDQIQNTLLSH